MKWSLAKYNACLVTIFFLCASQVQASLIYKFTGTVPANGGLTNPAIHVGETWTAQFAIKNVVGVPSSEFSTYPKAVIGGTLAFSGGYTSPYSFSDFNVVVFANGQRSSVFVYDDSGIGFQAFTETDVLLSKDLPHAGVAFAPGLPVTVPSYVQLIYSDASGEVSYTSSDANNVSFAALVPEPASLFASFLLWGTLTAAYCRQISGKHVAS
ncbi:hypothetical protein [Lacipirellula sp.]|uniref:hypothetical protein n=1 Tax=Lacipirellula sp. TaxID=2691419 RepID=UPI003D0F7FF2